MLNDVKFRRKKSGNVASVDFDKRNVLFIEEASYITAERLPFIIKHEGEHHAIVKARSMKASEQSDDDRIFEFVNGL